MAGEADRRGLAYGLSAYALWGLLPLYFALLRHVSAVEIVAQRILWSALLVAALVVATRRSAALRATFANPRAMAMLAASAVLIATNWLVYVWSVLNGQVLATSLAYFLNPLLNVALGVVLLRERLTRLQGIAIALAGIGVAILATGSLSALWISLTLAFSFAFYGLLRKLAPVGALEGLMVETALLAPIALAGLVWLSASAPLGIERDAGTASLLVVAGAATTAPLLLFAAAARRLKLATMGVLQFVAPSLQFLLAITVFGEPLTTAKLGCFVLIWIGLGIYIAGGVTSARRARMASDPA